MSDRRRHGTEDYQIAGLKHSMTSVASSSHGGAGDLQQQFSREDPPVKTTQYTLLQLINMVRENPILYDEEMQAATPDAQLKVQKREAWDRIRADIVWQDITLVQEVWSDLLDQYARKSIDMSDGLIEAMRWTDSLIFKKKSDSRPPSQLTAMSSGLDKDFYNDVPLAEDVLEPGQSLGNSESMKFDYVVIQPHVRPHQQIPTSSYSRRKSPQSRETEAIVRTYPLSPKRIVQQHRMPQKNNPDQQHQMNEVKKEVNPFGRQGVLVEVEPSPSYAQSNTKIYKMVSAHRSATPQPAVTVASSRRLPHRTNSLVYDSMPELIDSSNMPSEPPKKKIHLEVGHRNSEMVGVSTSSNAPCLPKEILTDGVPIADDEIILEADGECKIGSGMLLESQQSSSQNHEMDMPSTSMDHYHHQDIDDGGVGDDIEQQVVVGGPSDEMAIQYDEDLAFQQHINSVLNRLSDDEKSVMKFNMQKIILDARFGLGTARNMLKHDEMLEVESHVEIDPNHEVPEEI